MCQRLAPVSIDTAESLHTVGSIKLRLGEAEPEEYLRRSLALKRRVHADGHSIAGTLLVLSNLVEYKEVDDLLYLALDMIREYQPGGIRMARVLSNLAINIAGQGDYVESEALMRQALAIRRRLAPDSIDVARALSGLAVVLSLRGNQAEEEALLREALEIQERLVPESLSTASSLSNLGGTALLRGDFEASETYYRRALAIREKQGNVQWIGKSLLDLCEIARRRGDLEAAEDFCQRAFNTLSQVNEPWGPKTMAQSLLMRGMLEYQSKHFAAAESDIEQAAQLFAISESACSVDWVSMLVPRAEVAVALGKLDKAQQLVSQIMAFCDRYPGQPFSTPVPVRSWLRCGRSPMYRPPS
jgi:tetratricopeptide (TPR) repeat protein